MNHNMVFREADVEEIVFNVNRDLIVGIPNGKLFA